MDAGRVPVTIVTGFLGSGKTTLLNYILTAQHGRRIAVIENEFADDVGIESLILKDGIGGQVADGFYELQNGCMCCTMRDSLVDTLERLMAVRDKFDYVLIETSGMANPGPVAAAFWSDLGDAAAAMALDAIVTVIDAKHIVSQLLDPRPAGTVNEAAQQIACADVVLVNKLDTVEGDARGLGVDRASHGSATASHTNSGDEAASSSSGLASIPSSAASPPASPSIPSSLCSLITGINATAKLIPCVRGRVPLDDILCIGAFDPARLVEHAATTEPAVEGGSASASHEHEAVLLSKQHSHDPGIRTVVLRARKPVLMPLFRQWVGSLLWARIQEGDDWGDYADRHSSEAGKQGEQDGPEVPLYTPARPGGSGGPAATGEEEYEDELPPELESASQSSEVGREEDSSSSSIALNDGPGAHVAAPDAVAAAGGGGAGVSPAPPDAASSPPLPHIMRGKGVLCVAAEGEEQVEGPGIACAASGGSHHAPYHPAKHIFQSVAEQFDVQPATGVAALWTGDDLKPPAAAAAAAAAAKACSDAADASCSHLDTHQHQHKQEEGERQIGDSAPSASGHSCCNHSHTPSQVACDSASEGQPTLSSSESGSVLPYPISKLILIGRHLDEAVLQTQFDACCG